MIKEVSRFADSTVFEGMTSVRAVLDASAKGISDRRILRVLYDTAKESSKEKELSYIRRMGAQKGFAVQGVSAAEIDAVCTGNSHGGIIAECSERSIPALLPQHFPANGFVVMIEGIEDPYNFGYALRTIYAAGADAVILTPRNWMSAAGVVCRSSAGASELLPLFVCDPVEASGMAHSVGYSVACAGIRDSVSAFEADLRCPLLLIVGGEKRGISRAVLDTADLIVRLDYGREFRGSLSAASAASVLAYEVFRQNRRIILPDSTNQS